MSLKYAITLILISVFISGCSVNGLLYDYLWKNATPQAKQKRDAYYEMNCKAYPNMSLRAKPKDGYGVLYIYASGTSFCNFYVFPKEDDFELVVTGRGANYKEREIYLNGELIGKFNIWNFTVLPLKAGKYNLLYKGVEDVVTDIEIVVQEPVIFYPLGESKPAIGRYENFFRLYEHIFKWSRPFYFKMPEHEKYAKDTKEFLDSITCDAMDKK